MFLQSVTIIYFPLTSFKAKARNIEQEVHPMKTILILTFLLLTARLQAGDDLRRVVDLRGQWKFSIGDNPRWANADFDDSAWQTIFVPAAWENEGFSGFDGYAWYRVTFDLNDVSAHNLILDLGYIDDVDEVYLNGELIGFTGSFPPKFYTAYNAHRRYPLPADLLKTGKNVLAIRVYDTILEGGIIKGNVGIYTPRNEPEKTFSLEGIWKLREGDNQWWKEPDYDAQHWDEVVVPGFWGSLKDMYIAHGTAWYYRKFTLPQYLENEPNLVLVLGLIDDFDETYLNGQLIGATNDGKPLGWSNSWQEYRIYPIPENTLKRTGENIITVRVRDIGGNAGIYAGPLAIVPKKDYRQLLSTR